MRRQVLAIGTDNLAEARWVEVPIVLFAPVLQQSRRRNDQQRSGSDMASPHALPRPREERECLQRLPEPHVVSQQDSRATMTPGLLQPLQTLFLMRFEG